MTRSMDEVLRDALAHLRKIEVYAEGDLEDLDTVQTVPCASGQQT